jgi:hypothetical protein
MYRTFDDEIFLAPESVIFGLLATAADADEPDLPDAEPVPPFWAAVADEPAADAADVDADMATDESARKREEADAIDAWSRHARRASGFGG